MARPTCRYNSSCSDATGDECSADMFVLCAIARIQRVVKTSMLGHVLKNQVL